MGRFLASEHQIGTPCYSITTHLTTHCSLRTTHYSPLTIAYSYLVVGGEDPVGRVLDLAHAQPYVLHLEGDLELAWQG